VPPPSGFTDAGTVLPRLPSETSTVVQRPRRLGGISRADALNVVGAGAAGLSVAMLLFGRLAAFSGLLGFLVVAYLVFLLAYGVLVSLSDDGPAVRDRVMTVLLYTAAILMFGALVYVVAYTFGKGAKALVHTNFFTQDMSKAAGLAPLTVGGIKHALIGTLWMIGIALAISVPLGLACAVYISEVGGRFSRFVRMIVDTMTALPSIVAGLFIYATLVVTFHEKIALFAALAISIMMLPIITRAADVVLRLVPGNLREASAALGSPQWRTVRHVVLPTARSGLVTAVILGMARGIGETAPVLLTVGYTTYLNTNPLHGPMVSLPLAAFTFVSSGIPTLVARGFATAAFLLFVVLVLFAIARVLGGRGVGHVTRRQARRIRRRSAHDAARFNNRMPDAGFSAATGTAP
jgi:phosphate transport system permease protein